MKNRQSNNDELLDTLQELKKKRREEIHIEKEEIHEFFEQIRSENRKKSHRKNIGD